MHDITDVNNKELPSTKTLIKATALAFLMSCTLLIIAILPAEYGIDPTGLGEKIGLTVLNTDNAIKAEDITMPSDSENVSATVSPVWKSNMKYRSDTMTLTLQSGEGAEIKTKMKAGENFSFNWEIKGGVVNFDMHGEKVNDGDKFTSYWLGYNESSSSGSFSAPFDGTHGWYWKNNGKKAVTVKLTASGFYDTFYRP